MCDVPGRVRNVDHGASVQHLRRVGTRRREHICENRRLRCQERAIDTETGVSCDKDDAAILEPELRVALKVVERTASAGRRGGLGRRVGILLGTQSFVRRGVPRLVGGHVEISRQWGGCMREAASQPTIVAAIVTWTSMTQAHDQQQRT